MQDLLLLLCLLLLLLREVLLLLFFFLFLLLFLVLLLLLLLFAVVAALTGIVAVVAVPSRSGDAFLFCLCLRALLAFPLWLVVLLIPPTNWWPRRAASDTGRIATGSVAVSLAAAVVRGQSRLATVGEVAAPALAATPRVFACTFPTVEHVLMMRLLLAAVSCAAW